MAPAPLLTSLPFDAIFVWVRGQTRLAEALIRSPVGVLAGEVRGKIVVVKVDLSGA